MRWEAFEQRGDVLAATSKTDAYERRTKGNGMSYVRNADGGNEGSSRRGGEMWADLKATLKSCQLLVMN